MYIVYYASNTKHKKCNIYIVLFVPFKELNDM